MNLAPITLPNGREITVSERVADLLSSVKILRSEIIFDHGTESKANLTLALEVEGIIFKDTLNRTISIVETKKEYPLAIEGIFKIKIRGVMYL